MKLIIQTCIRQTCSMSYLYLSHAYNASFSAHGFVISTFKNARLRVLARSKQSSIIQKYSSSYSNPRSLLLVRHRWTFQLVTSRCVLFHHTVLVNIGRTNVAYSYLQTMNAVICSDRSCRRCLSSSLSYIQLAPYLWLAREFKMFFQFTRVAITASRVRR